MSPRGLALTWLGTAMVMVSGSRRRWPVLVRPVGSDSAVLVRFGGWLRLTYTLDDLGAEGGGTSYISGSHRWAPTQAVPSYANDSDNFGKTVPVVA